MNPNNSDPINYKFNTTDQSFNNAFYSENGDKFGQEYNSRIPSEFNPNAFSMNNPFNHVFPAGSLNPDLNGFTVPIPNLSIPISANPLLPCFTTSINPALLAGQSTFTPPPPPAPVQPMAPQFQQSPFNLLNPSTDLLLQYLAALQSLSRFYLDPSQMFNAAGLGVQPNVLPTADTTLTTPMSNLDPRDMFNPNLSPTKVDYVHASTVPSPSGSSSSSCNASEIDSLEDRLDDISIRKKERAALVPAPEEPKETPEPVRVQVRSNTTPRAKPLLDLNLGNSEVSGRTFGDSTIPFTNEQLLKKSKESIDTSPSPSLPTDLSYCDQDHENAGVSHVPTKTAPHKKKFHVSSAPQQREESVSPSQAVPVNSSGSHSPEPNEFEFGETVEKRRKVDDDDTERDTLNSFGFWKAMVTAICHKGNVKTKVARDTIEFLVRNIHSSEIDMDSIEIANDILVPEILDDKTPCNESEEKATEPTADLSYDVCRSLAAMLLKSVRASQTNTPAGESTMPTTSIPDMHKSCRKRKLLPLFMLQNSLENDVCDGECSPTCHATEAKETAEASKIPDDPVNFSNESLDKELTAMETSAETVMDVPVELPVVIPAKAQLKAKVETPKKQSVKSTEKTSVKKSVTTPVRKTPKMSVKKSSKTPMKRLVKTQVDTSARTSGKTAVEAPTEALVSVSNSDAIPRSESPIQADDMLEDPPVIKDYDSEEESFLVNGKKKKNVCASFMRAKKDPHSAEDHKEKVTLTPVFFENIVAIGGKARQFPIDQAVVARSVVKKSSNSARRGRPKRQAAMLAAAAVRSESVPLRKRKGQVAVGTYTAQDEVDTEGNTVVTHDPTLSCGSADDCYHPDQLSLSWIRCDQCSTWFHRVCIQFLAGIMVTDNDLFICGCVTSTHEVLYQKGFLSGRKPLTPDMIDKIVKVSNIQTALRARASETGEDPSRFDDTVSQEDLNDIENFLNSYTKKSDPTPVIS